MNEALTLPISDLDHAEFDRIEALESALGSAMTRRDEHAIRTLRDELSEARMSRISRITNETWDALEQLVGQKLRRG